MSPKLLTTGIGSKCSVGLIKVLRMKCGRIDDCFIPYQAIPSSVVDVPVVTLLGVAFGLIASAITIGCGYGDFQRS